MKPYTPWGCAAAVAHPASAQGYDASFAVKSVPVWNRKAAARVALTYNSAISYDLPTTESSFSRTNPMASVTTPSTTNTETPQSVNLEFQSGVAKNITGVNHTRARDGQI